MVSIGGNDCVTTQSRFHLLPMKTNFMLRISLTLVVLASLAPSIIRAANSNTTNGLDPALVKFVEAKKVQVQGMRQDMNLDLPPEVSQFFDSVLADDFARATNLFRILSPFNQPTDSVRSFPDLRKGPICPLMEVIGAYDQSHLWGSRLAHLYGDEIIKSIPAGSIYFGGTDAGRSIVSALSDSQIEGKPFFTLTQNALADETYVDYLRRIYGKQVHLPSASEMQIAFSTYVKDVQSRFKHDSDPALSAEPRQLKSGEAPIDSGNGKVAVTGQVSVMAINALLAKAIFDANPNREFYLEESFPLDWIYPRATPNGPIVKINRNPVPELTEDMVQQDRLYWRHLTGMLIGDWITQETSLKEICDFATRIYLDKELQAFKGDKSFAASKEAHISFAKLRLTIADVYAWRLGFLLQTSTPAECLPKSGEARARMIAAADYAYRQAFALCPESSEVVYRYVQFLGSNGRFADALLVASTSLKLEPANEGMSSLVKQLKPLANQQEK